MKKRTLEGFGVKISGNRRKVSFRGGKLVNCPQVDRGGEENKEKKSPQKGRKKFERTYLRLPRVEWLKKVVIESVAAKTN